MILATLVLSRFLAGLAMCYFPDDDDFLHEYVHGFPEELIDGIKRLGFPRFLTYSADYPEK